MWGVFNINNHSEPRHTSEMKPEQSPSCTLARLKLWKSASKESVVEGVLLRSNTKLCYSVFCVHAISFVFVVVTFFFFPSTVGL